jgi:hypothetical protein
MTDAQLLGYLRNQRPLSPVDKALIKSLMAKERLANRNAVLEATKGHLQQLWMYAKRIQREELEEGEVAPELKELFAAQLTICSPWIGEQECADLDTRLDKSLEANAIRKMARLIAPEDLNPQEILAYADCLEE